MCSIILLSQENIICLASFTFSVLQVFDYNLTTKNSSSLNSLSLISVIHFHWLRVKKKLFLPFPDSDDFVLLSPGLIIMWACSLEACFTWTKIFSSTSSILHCIKDHISRAALLVTTYWLPTYSYLLLTLPLCLVFPLQLYLISKGTIQPYVHYISGTSSSLLEQGNYQ